MVECPRGKKRTRTYPKNKKKKLSKKIFILFFLFKITRGIVCVWFFIWHVSPTISPLFFCFHSSDTFRQLCCCRDFIQSRKYVPYFLSSFCEPFSTVHFWGQLFWVGNVPQRCRERERDDRHCDTFDTFHGVVIFHATRVEFKSLMGGRWVPEPFSLF